MSKVALITGSSRGIGLATAKKFLEESYKVAIFCRHQSHVEQAKAKLLNSGNKDNIWTGVADVANSQDVDRVVKKTLIRFGSLDVLVNNAGVGLYKPIEKTTEQEWDNVLSINLKGPYLCIKTILPIMHQQERGIIVNVSSGLGVSAEGKYGAYSASKFGIMALTEVVADENKDRNVRVYAVMPGAVATKLHLDMHPWEKSEDMMQPEHIAQKIHWLVESNKPTGFKLPIYS